MVAMIAGSSALVLKEEAGVPTRAWEVVVVLVMTTYERPGWWERFRTCK